MARFLSKASLGFILSTTVLLAGCGSDGGGGGGASINTAPAAIDIDNAEAIGKAAGESILVADASNSLPTGIVTGDNTSTDLTWLNTIFIDAANTVITTSNLPAGIDMSYELCSSGTASYTITGTSGPVDITFSYNNCTLEAVALQPMAHSKYITMIYQTQIPDSHSAISTLQLLILTT